MKCPHCLAELKYVDRPKRTCRYCQQQFALEPRENELKLSDLKLRGLAEWLSRKGVCRYTAAQLAHAAVRQRLKPDYHQIFSFPNLVYPRSWLWFVALAAIVFFTLVFLSMSIEGLISSILVLVVLLLLPIILEKKLQRFPDPRSLQFEALYIEPWQAIHGPLPGLANYTKVTSLRQTHNHIPIEQVRAFVVSPVEDVLYCLLANELPQRLWLTLINPYHSDLESQLALVRRHPQIPILVIHDASVAGCLLPALLPQQWRLTPAHRVIDLGLRPADVQLYRLPWRYDPVDKLSLELLHQAQSTGATNFSDDEMKWLTAGSVTSVLFLPPAQLIRLVVRAVEQYGPPGLDPKAEAQARAIGFMTWPQPSA
ncbi:MAG: ABC transporter permease [Chloroflexus sp.]